MTVGRSGSFVCTLCDDQCNSRCAVISQRVAPWYTALISTGVCIQVCTVDSAENIGH